MSDFGAPWGGYRYNEQWSMNGPTGSVNTKGAYAQGTASSLKDTHLIQIHILGGDHNRRLLLDFAIGAAAAETILVADIQGFEDPTNEAGLLRSGLWLPVNIPAGTRISARAQSSLVSPLSFTMTVESYGRAHHATAPSSGNIVTYGTVTANSTGTACTNGVYTQMTAATTYNHAGLWLVITPPNGIDDQAFTIDVAIGAAASEIIIWTSPTLIQRGSPSSGVGNAGLAHYYYWIPRAIPAGTRLSVRRTFLAVTSDDMNCSIIGY